MNFRPAKLTLPLLGLAMRAMVLSGEAQSAGVPADQSIIFSAPADNHATPDAPSLAPRMSGQQDFANAFQTPSSIFNFRHSSADAPLPPPSAPAISQDLLDARNNWALMTPEEILGEATPEKIMGIPERDAMGQKENLTALDRYLARQNQSADADTNGFQNGRSSSRWDFSENQGDLPDADIFSSINRRSGNSQTLNHFSNSAVLNAELAAQNGNGAMLKLLGSSAPSPDPTMAAQQAADMERFQQLLNPSPPPAATPTFNNSAFSSTDAKLDQSPLGSLPTFQNSDLGKLTSLPTPPSVAKTLPTVPTPAWAPQLAPWLSQTPQPFVIPQRKF